MSKTSRVPVYGAPAKFVRVEAGATVGAQLGVNLLDTDGSLLTVARLLELLAADEPAQDDDTAPVATAASWNTLSDIPTSVAALGELGTAGIIVRQAGGTLVTRTVEGVAGETTSANESGEGGNPTIGLWTVGNTASGALLSVEVDIKGRIIGYRDADAIDIIDALGYTPEPVIASGTTAQFLRGDKAWSNNIVGDIFVGANGTSLAVRVGYGAAAVSTNTVVGRQAQGQASFTGNSSVFVGYLAGANASSGIRNTVVGSEAMGNGVNTGNSNSAFGWRALYKNTAGGTNCAFGFYALAENTTGSNNMAVGPLCLQANTTGSNNSAIGYGALSASTTGAFNVAIGTNATYLLTTGNRNVGIGYYAGATSVAANANISGNDNTYIGNNSGPGTPTQLSFATAIGATATVTTSNTTVLGRAAIGVVVVGATGDSGGGCKLQVTGHLGVLGAGNGLRVAEGANAKQGVATLVAGTVVVANTSVTANSRIFLTIQNPNGGTPGAVYIAARVAGTSFTITSTSGADVSTVAYEIFEPGT